MYVVKKAGKCLSEKGSFPSIVGRLPTVSKHGARRSRLSPLSYRRSSNVFKKKTERKENALYFCLTKIFLQLVFTHTELRIFLISSKSRKNTSRAVVVKVFVMFCFVLSQGVTS